MRFEDGFWVPERPHIRHLLDDVVLVAITRVAITQAGSDLYSLFVEPVCTKYRVQA